MSLRLSSTGRLLPILNLQCPGGITDLRSCSCRGTIPARGELLRPFPEKEPHPSELPRSRYRNWWGRRARWRVKATVRYRKAAAGSSDSGPMRATGKGIAQSALEVVTEMTAGTPVAEMRARRDTVPRIGALWNRLAQEPAPHRQLRFVAERSVDRETKSWARSRTARSGSKPPQG